MDEIERAGKRQESVQVTGVLHLLHAVDEHGRASGEQGAPSKRRYDWNAVIGVATAFAAVFTFRIVILTQDNLVASQRAWVLPETTGIDNLSTNAVERNEIVGHTLRIWIRNFGLSAAYGLHSQHFPGCEPRDLSLPEYRVDPIESGVILPPGHLVMLSDYQTRERELKETVFFIVAYRDQFRQVRRTAFCVEGSWNEPTAEDAVKLWEAPNNYAD
jgi:hypothetical protein